MAEEDVLKSFLISLGFKVDSASYNKFANAVTGSTSLAQTLGKVTAAAVVSTTAAVTAVANAMDKLYYVSQRTGSSVSSIQAFDYAISQTGGSAEGAKQSLENLGHFIRSYPGSGEFLKRLGVNPEHVSSAVDSLKDMKQTLTDMPFYQAQAYANVLGIDEKTLLSLRSGEIDKNLEDYNNRLKDSGAQAENASLKGKEFMNALRGVGAEAEVLGVALEDKLAGPLTSVVKWMDRGIASWAWILNNVSSKDVAGALRQMSPDSFYPKGAGTSGQSADTGATGGIATKEQLIQRIMSKGYSREVASGMARRLMIESSGNPSAVGDGGDAYGLFQAHREWRSEFKRVTGKDIHGSSWQEQTDFITDYALTDKSTDPDARRTGAALRRAKSEDESYRLFTNGFEKPAVMAGSSVTQNITMNVSGPDPHTTAGLVAQKQGEAASQLARVSAGGARR